MTNPNNAIGTNAAYSGRTSVNAFNDVLSAFSRGVVSGWACVPNSGLTVSLGGDGSTRDVAIAVDNTGNATTINNISNSPVDVTISSAPASNSRIDLIVAYVDNPPQGVSTTADNPAACGLVVVKGTVAASPVAPNESVIRTAITSDGASGTTAYYVVLAQILIATGTTTLTSDNIQNIPNSKLDANQVDLNFLLPDTANVEIETGLVYGGKKVYAQRFTGSVAITAYTMTTETLIGSGVETVIETIGWAQPGASYAKSKIGSYFVGGDGAKITINGGHYLSVSTTNELQFRIVYITGGTASYDFVCFYTKV